MQVESPHLVVVKPAIEIGEEGILDPQLGVRTLKHTLRSVSVLILLMHPIHRLIIMENQKRDLRLLQARLRGIHWMIFLQR